MTIELDGDERARAIESVQRFAREEFGQEFGELKAGVMLEFVLAELAPLAYNRGVRDAQARIQTAVGDLDGDCFEPPFGFWSRGPLR